ncbi:MAG: cyanophycin synthetase [Clostridiales bacterium]|nr:cyanophycin synthetase [Clostridiales bacterium]
MKIQELKVYEPPSIYSVREPIIKIEIKLGELADTPTKDIDKLNENIIRLFPGIKDHKCAKDYVGGFLERLEEGTYLAHVTEHLCLETQRMLGYDIKHGKARQLNDDIYNIIFSCAHVEIGKACGHFVVKTINALIEGHEVDIEKDFQQLKKVCVKYDLGVSTTAIIEEAKKRNIPVSLVNDGEIIRLGYGKHQRLISATLYEGTSSIAVDIACDKQLTKTILDESFIPIPYGEACQTFESALQIVNELGYPVVIKPKNGNKGKHVYINLNNEDEIKWAFQEAMSFDGEVIVEKYIEGKDYRLLVVNGKFVAAAERIPAQIKGDGLRSIEELIKNENNNVLRGEGHEKPLTKINIDENLLKTIKRQNFSLESIPPLDHTVLLRENANLSTGGIAVDCTDIVHPNNKEIAELAAKSVGLDIAGIDMVIPDISEPIHKGFGAIVEVNAAPGIRMHLKPAIGVSRDVVSPILDMMYPENEPFSIPIVSITGTNGKTTTTRMISRILNNAGYSVGTTTTHGIYVNNKCLVDGDTTGPKSARRILYHKEVDAAVLETARGGIVRDGLAYEKADVAVFINLTEDHLGIDGINTMDELLHVKSLVIEAVKEDGACILNADDPWIMKVKEKAKGKIVLFSLDAYNPLLINHVKDGGRAVYKKGDGIFISHNGTVREAIKIPEIPATLNGGLKHNIYNSMAAIGASIILNIPLEIICNTLRAFSCDAHINPGRFNVYELGDFKVVLDYGHNIDGYRTTIDGLRSLNPVRLTGIIGVPGDRRDEDIKRIGRLSGTTFDRIIIKEDEDLRGRKPFEVAKILLSGVLEGTIDKNNVSIILNEAAALKDAIIGAISGEVIVVFFEIMEPLVDLLNDFKKQDSYLRLQTEPILV